MSNVSPIPPGFHSLTLHLNVDGASKYLDFLKRAFEAEEIHLSHANGKVMHATVKIGDSMLMFADDFSQEFGAPPVVRGNLPFAINLYVIDADATWARALEAGCTVKFPLGDQFWGDRYGQVLDPFGFVWAITMVKEILTPEQMMDRAPKELGGGH